MKYNYKYFLLLFVAFLLFSCNQKETINQIPLASKGIIDLSSIDFENNEIIALDGEWEFYWDTLLSPEDFQNESFNLAPQYIPVPLKWEKFSTEKLKYKNGYATYRLKIKLHPDTLNYGILVFRIFSAYKMFINNKLIGEVGKVGHTAKEEKGAFNYLSYFIPHNEISNNEIEIIIQISNFQRNKSGLVKRIYFGNFVDINKNYQYKIYITLFILGIFIIIFLYHLTLFLHRKQEYSYLFFAIICLAMIFRIITTNDSVIYLMFPNLNFQIFLKIDLITAYGMPVLFTLYLKSLFKADVHKKILKIIIYLGVAIVLFILFTQSWINKKLEIVFILYAMLSSMYMIFIYLTILYIKKYQYVVTAFIGIFLFFATGVNDVLSTLTIINTPFLMHYGLVIYIISQSYLLSIKSAENLKSVETLSKELKYNNENLEIIVKERTQEIESQKEELFTQKEEILATNDELYELNNKLEKFSVVVSQTDNSVIITDPKGIIEWTNQRFEKVLEIDNVVGKSIFDISVNNDFAILFNKCIESKSSMVYTSEFNKDDKTLIWTTTLTPILDEENVITGIVAIDSDITEIQNASKKIEHQNKLIKQSIQSALTIQQAMLPSQTDISRFYQNFIIFKPKDIVSGDFYWFLADNYSSKNEKTQTTFIAAVDCTGHGVPGAFMSMIGNSLLNKIVIEQKIANPSEIITRLDLEIIKMLKQELTNNQDGLDICFCKIILCENEKINVVFCGAKLPIYYYISGTNTIEKIKGDVKSVGGAKHKNKSQFENKEFILNKNDQIFLTTDGFVDQNNFERRRFGFTNFSSVLINCTKLSINEQKDYMLKELAIWQKNEEQRDDITVIGIKF